MATSSTAFEDPQYVSARLKQGDLGPIKDYSPKDPLTKIYDDFVHDKLRPVKKCLARTQSESAYQREEEKAREWEKHIYGAGAYRKQEQPNLFANLDTKTKYASDKYRDLIRKTPISYEPGRTYRLLHDLSDNHGYHRHMSRAYAAGDSDYFDTDLEHAIEGYRTTSERYRASLGPSPAEQRLFHDITHEKGDRTLMGRALNTERDYRYQNGSYLSAAIRTPSYWKYRFENS